MPKKGKGTKRKIETVTEEENCHETTNMQSGCCKSVVFDISANVTITPSATVHVNQAKAMDDDCAPSILIDTLKSACPLTVRNQNGEMIAKLLDSKEISSRTFRSFRVTSSILLLIFDDSLLAFNRNTCELLSIIDLSAKNPASDACIVMTEDDKVAILNASVITTTLHGGSACPGALSCNVFNCTSGDMLAEYEIPFKRVAYFPSTLRAHCRDNRLMVSCWDDMQLKVIDLESGTEQYILEKNEENESRHISDNGGLEASVKVICVGNDYIAVGYEWQRYVKACPLRVYATSSGERLHCLPANGASPKCLAIHDNDQLLFSSACNQKEVRVYSLEFGTKLYSLPNGGGGKTIDFTLRPDSQSLYVRSNESGEIWGGSDNALTVTCWNFCNNDNQDEKNVGCGGSGNAGDERGGVIVVKGKVQKASGNKGKRIM